MTATHSLLLRTAGFTILELVLVVVVLGILSIVAFTTQTSSVELSLPSQAEKMAADIRKAQTLAITSGLAVTFTASAGGYGADCSTSCSGAFSELLKDVSSTAGSVSFSSNGQPGSATSFTLSTASGASKTVAVAAVTGHVTVMP